MLNNLGLGFVFTARDLASGTIQGLERNFTSLDRRVGLGTARIETSFQRLGVAMAIFTAGAVTVGASLSLANVAGQFEQALAGVAAVSGASAEVLGQLRDAAIQASLAKNERKQASTITSSIPKAPASRCRHEGSQ